MKTSSTKMINRITAGTLIFVLTLLVPMTPLAIKNAKAASVQKKYIKEVKTLTLEYDIAKNAHAWCDDQPENKDDDPDNDWSIVGENLNRGARGSWHASSGAVYLAYRTTTDPSEAITDLAVMNEKGNYSEGAFERLLNSQKDQYKDLVNNLKDMLAEYRKNLANEVPAAMQARKFLNSYVEDDSGKNLGDLLVDISDDDLATLFLQMNGAVVLTVQQQLAFACDTAETTFLDRMQTLGSFDKLRKKFLQAYKNNAKKADKALDDKYKEKATALYDSWDDVYQHFDNLKKRTENYGVNDMSESEFTEWAKLGEKDPEILTYIQERTILETLIGYNYDDGTLLNFFSTEKKEFDGDGLKKLYPLAACLSDGQFAAMSESVSLFMIIQDALGAGVYNEKSSTGSDSEKKILDNAKESLDILTKEANKEKTSVYAGVNREIFNGGVAVTSTAESYSSGTETSWADHFVDSGQLKKCTWGLTISALSMGMLAIAAREAHRIVVINNFQKVFFDIGGARGVEAFNKYGISTASKDYVCACARDVNTLYRNVVYGHNTTATKAFNEIYKASTTTPKARGFNMLKRGFAVFAILLTVVDITLNVIALVKYYNRDHLPIPHHMVDLSYNKAKESSYIIYKSVLDASGKCSDLNGDIGKQWLALYQTKDEDAGAPILAPDGENNKIIVQYGSDKTPDGYSPLHIFGSNNTPQNLTYADGENGWSFNDDKNGTYLFFVRDNEIGSGNSKGDNAQSATAISGGVNVLLGAVCVVAGIFIGSVITNFNNRKNKRIS